MADAKAGDRRVIGDLVGADHAEGDVLATTFALDGATGSWGRALPVDLNSVAVVRLLPARGGAPLVYKLGD